LIAAADGAGAVPAGDTEGIDSTSTAVAAMNLQVCAEDSTVGLKRNQFDMGNLG
jgi:hypothetical protein